MNAWRMHRRDKPERKLRPNKCIQRKTRSEEQARSEKRAASRRCRSLHDLRRFSWGLWNGECWSGWIRSFLAHQTRFSSIFSDAGRCFWAYLQVADEDSKVTAPAHPTTTEHPTATSHACSIRTTGKRQNEAEGRAHGIEALRTTDAPRSRESTKGNISFATFCGFVY